MLILCRNVKEEIFLRRRDYFIENLVCYLSSLIARRSRAGKGINLDIKSKI